MAAVATYSDRDPGVTTRVEAPSERGEPLVDRVLSIVAMVGGAGGATAGVVLGAEADTAFPVACGTLGTMLGSGLAAGGWCLLVRLWKVLFPRNKTRYKQNRAARPNPITPAPSAG
jgi:hypothetical protein